MKNLKYFLAFVFAFVFNIGNAQFVQEAKVTYERKTNLWKKVEAENDDNDEQWIIYFKKTNPQYKIDSFSLAIKNNITLYSPLGEEVVNRNMWWNNDPATRNEVHSDYNTAFRTSFKGVFEDDFLIVDSVTKYKWKITTETRNVGGFECRKATTTINDSVFVIAFYTDQIMATGGPESFSGLPGCILGLAIPRLYTTWFATGIQIKAINDNELLAPKKGKKTNNKQLNDKLKGSIGKWGKWGQKYMHLINI